MVSPINLGDCLGHSVAVAIVVFPHGYKFIKSFEKQSNICDVKGNGYNMYHFLIMLTILHFAHLTYL